MRGNSTSLETMTGGCHPEGLDHRAGIERQITIMRKAPGSACPIINGERQAQGICGEAERRIVGEDSRNEAGTHPGNSVVTLEKCHGRGVDFFLKSAAE